MKPLFLKLQAFGPFSKTTSVSFENVFDGGLFLIHGRTGSGKTSLLDGLCFSLFGRPSTTEREKDLRALRADHADSAVATETELVFAIGETSYRVHRVPTQVVPKKRGEGTTELKGSAELWRYQGTLPSLRSDLQKGVPLIEIQSWEPIASKLEAVDLAIENLLGMNERQFRQVIILPQGHFREFLSSNSADRQKILERLFQTDRFSRLQTFLTTHVRDLETKWKQHTSEIERKLKDEGLLDAEAIAPKRESLSAEEAELKKTALAAKRQTDEIARELARAQEAASAKKRLETLVNAREKQDAAKPEFETRRRRLTFNEILLPYYEAAKALKAVADRLATNRSRFTEAQKSSSDALKRATEIANERDGLQSLQPSILSLTEERARLRAIVPILSDAAKTREAILSEQNELELIRAKSTKAKSRQVEITSKLNGLAVELTALHSADLARENAEVESEECAVNELELRYHRTEASRLAKLLKKNEPCPVCGSLAHPDPAHGSEKESVDADSVRLARKRFDILKSRVTKARSDRESAIANLSEEFPDIAKSGMGTLSGRPFADVVRDFNSIAAEIRKLETDLEIQAKELETRGAGLSKQTAALEARLAEVPAEHRSLDVVMKRGMEIKTEQDRREALLGRLDTDLKVASAQASQLQGTLATLSREIEMNEREYQEATRLLDSIFQSAREKAPDLPHPDSVRLSEVERESLAVMIARFDGEVLETASAIREVESTLKSHTDQAALRSVQELTDLRNRYDSERETAEAKLTRTTVQIERLTKLEKEIARETESLGAMKAESERAIRIGGLVSGDRAYNKLSVPLARFVLQSRFEDVLDQANHRLSRMSRGRFLLRRPALSRNLTHSQGLDLSVEDSLTGKERHANSLSGGESFMAALSLALGLADVVQADLGGVRLDSVMIDEGFGTLDAESLELALRTLVDLQAGGRVVGVISHVQELKSQIEKRLEVHSSADGSSARWEHTRPDRPVSKWSETSL